MPKLSVHPKCMFY